MGVIENEVFMSIEDSIAVRAKKLVHDVLDDEIRQAGILTDQGLFDAARDILDGMDVSQELFELNGFLNTKFIQAALFGSSQLVEPEQSILIFEPHLTDLFPNSILQFQGIINGGIRVVRDTGHKFIRAREEDEVDVAVNDGIIKSWGGHVHMPVEVFKNEFTGLFNKALDGNLNALVSISANLTTSRLISYGFLVEASANGILQYEVSEVLDNRTCPVCELMHGMVFDVEVALGRITELLNITDPAQLKARAPFASQSAASLAELRTLSMDELASRGMDAPPYHPLCRGITVEIGRQIGSVTETIRQVRPGQVIQGPGGPKIVQPTAEQAPATAVIEPTLAIPVTELGTLAPETVSAVRGALADLPLGVQRVVAANGWKVELSETIRTSTSRSLLRRRPRGWPKGSTFKEVGGWANPELKKVSLMESTIAKNKTVVRVDMERTLGTVRHETGHALDSTNLTVAGKPLRYSQTSAFREAYDADTFASRGGILSKPDLAWDYSYLLQKGAAGRSEAFAELFAKVNGGGGLTRLNVLDWPNVTKFIEGVIKDLA